MDTFVSTCMPNIRTCRST